MVEMHFVGGPMHGESCVHGGDRTLYHMQFPDPNWQPPPIDFDSPEVPRLEGPRAFQYEWTGKHAVIAGKRREVYVYRG